MLNRRSRGLIANAQSTSPSANERRTAAGGSDDRGADSAGARSSRREFPSQMRYSIFLGDQITGVQLFFLAKMVPVNLVYRRIIRMPRPQGDNAFAV
jgi:hypothetical protein